MPAAGTDYLVTRRQSGGHATLDQAASHDGRNASASLFVILFGILENLKPARFTQEKGFALPLQFAVACYLPIRLVSANGALVGRRHQFHRDPAQLVFDEALYADSSLVLQAPFSREPDNVTLYALLA